MADVERRLDNRARLLLAEKRRLEKRIAKDTEQLGAVTADLIEIHHSAQERFGVKVPLDALLLDVLGQIDVEDDSRWRWRGQRNNKRLGVVKTLNREMSVVRYLAIEFGVIGEDDQGLLYPAHGDADDINPWHRKFRRAEAPVGNPDRFRFSLEETG